MRSVSSLWIALFGCETRYVGKLYAERIFIFAVLILAVVLSLDAANHLSGFLSSETQPGAPSGLVRLSHYLALRGGYNLPAILPIAALVGVIWAEFALARSRQRIMISNSGRPSLRSLAPAIVVGLVIGLLQFVALAYVRPASVEAQAVEGFRYYGPKFNAPAETGIEWISVEGTVIKTRIAFADPPTLRDAVFFDLGEDGTLRSIRTAQSAVPAGDGTWILANGTEWNVPVFSSFSTPGAPIRNAGYFDGQAVLLALDPLWVENFGILPSLLPQHILARLGTVERGIQNASTYEAAYQDRFAAILYVVGMVLLPAAMGMSWFMPGMGPGPMIRVIVSGVGAYFGASIVTQLGSYGYLPALVSAWAAPVIFIGTAVGIVLTTARVAAR